MKKARRSEEQIIGILAEHDAGAKCADLCRKHGMSDGTFYAWKAKYSGMTVPEAKRLKTLEDENANLGRNPLDIDLRAILHRIQEVAPGLLEPRLHRLGRLGNFGLDKRAVALGEVRPIRVLDDPCPSKGRSHGFLHPGQNILTVRAARLAEGARDESSARRAIAQPEPTGVNNHRAPVAAG